MSSKRVLLIFPCTYLYLIATYLPDMLSNQEIDAAITVAAAIEPTANGSAESFSSLSDNVPSQDPKPQALEPRDWREQHRVVWKKFDTQVRQSTPVNVQECGTALLDALGASEKQRVPVDSCAVAAWRSHRPFRARYYAGKPQKLAAKLILVGTSQGYVHFRWILAGVGSVLPSAGEHLCESPRIVAVHGQQRIECPDWYQH